MTHDELRDYIDKFDAAGMFYEPAIRTIRVVVELHKQRDDNSCNHCVTWYPCDTIQAIEKELA